MCQTKLKFSCGEHYGEFFHLATDLAEEECTAGIHVCTVKTVGKLMTRYFLVAAQQLKFTKKWAYGCGAS